MKSPRPILTLNLLLTCFTAPAVWLAVTWDDERTEALRALLKGLFG